jgi:predicted nucleotidyltransferase
MNAPVAVFPFDADKLSEICRQNDGSKVNIIGPLACGVEHDQGEIDLLDEFSKRKSLLALVALERQLSAALGKKVDLLTEGTISLYLRDRIRQA